ncbi:MAG TPA: alpha-hydroxy acid oxidase [Pilimelia sp.]|nr:alpha-hydroxy acid oxidase [Pilimelia sp.]
MSLICAEDFQRLAHDRLSADVWDFIEGGSGAELTLAANRAAFTQLRLRPRVMVDVTTCTTDTTLLGTPLRVPFGIAPLAYHQLAHADGEVGTALGAGGTGALFVVSMFASRTLEDIAAAATGPLWLQLYWLRRRDVMAQLVRRAAAAGYRALVLTVDAPAIGRRLRDLRNGFAVDAEVQAVNLDPALMELTHRRRTGSSAIARHAAATFDPSLTWADLAWLRETCDLPLVVKGILTAEDAKRAVACGVDAMIVSNHGGRQLDRAVPSLHALAEVVDAVGNACPVLFDGGVRGGADVFMALALGARAVFLGRPVLWALAVDGGAGVAQLLDLVGEELRHTMALTGRPALSDIDRSVLAAPPPPAR